MGAATDVSASQPVHIASLSVPHLWIPLILNVLTQYVAFSLEATALSYRLDFSA